MKPFNVKKTQNKSHTNPLSRHRQKLDFSGGSAIVSTQEAYLNGADKHGYKIVCGNFQNSERNSL